MITGVRRGELCALRRRHVDPASGTLVVRASIAQIGAEVWEKDTKLHQRRHISLDPDTVALFLDYHQTRQHRAATVGTTLTPDERLASHHTQPRSQPTTLHLQSAFPLGPLESSQTPVSLAGQALPCTYSTRRLKSRESPRLAHVRHRRPEATCADRQPRSVACADAKWRPCGSHR